MSSNGRVTKFGLRNFKAFHYLEDIELKPLTVLVGSNSSEKSSIFQALLLLKQSSEASRSSALLKFDGEWTKLGSFANVVSDFDISRNIEYRFEIADAIVLPPAGKVTSFRYSKVEAEIKFVFGAGPEPGQVVLQRSGIRARSAHGQPMEVEYGGGVPPKHENVRFEGWGQPNPFEILEVRDAKISKFWLESLDVMFQMKPHGANKQNFYVSQLPMELSPMGTLRSLIEERLEYLGPIRADPRPFYPVEEDMRIGARGDGTIPYLLKRQNDLVSYAPSSGGELREAPLLEAVNDWLQRMKVTSRLTIDPVEPIAHTAAIRSTSAMSKPVNLAQVGFGISQLLPVLVMGLKSAPGAWLLFEQPESQLHPRLQGDLADFFLATARADKTVMVETHSDHLVNRLRRRIAEDETGELAKLVQILFVHAGTPEDPSSYVEPLAVDESGTIVNCPSDFFSESSDESFAILSARRARAAKDRK